MQCKDIDDDQFLVAVHLLRHSGLGALAWDVAEALEINEKLMLAKASKLIKAGKMSGCACGCRGDFEVVV